MISKNVLIGYAIGVTLALMMKAILTGNPILVFKLIVHVGVAIILSILVPKLTGSKE